MPRPKRSRIAPSRPAAQAPQSSATPPTVTESAAASRRNGPSSDIYDVSDREKQRRRTRTAEKSAVEEVEREGRVRRGLEITSERARALKDSKRRRDEAMDKLDNITSTSTHADGSLAEDAGSPAVEYSRRESASMAVTSQPARLTDASGLDLDDEVFGNLDDSLDDSENAIDDTQSAHHTRSTDTSSFNIAMFRRRPRQSSIVGKDDAPIRPSSRGTNTPNVSSHLNLGRFKRRQREPSILGTVQKESAPRPQSRASNYGSEMGDDSGPDDESTPLDKTKRHSGSLQAAENSREASPALPSRKRKSLEDQGGREKRPALDSREDDIHQSIEIDSTPPPSPSLRGSRADYPSTPDRDDPDMAPPASGGSSDGGSPIIWPSLDSLAHRTYNARKLVHARTAKTPELDEAASDISSPPSLTHSPNYGPVRTRSKRKPAASAPKLTTADLTSLLPRRRHNASGRDDDDPFDLDSSDENVQSHDNEDDELSYADSRAAAARRRRAAALAQSTTNRGGKGKAPASAENGGKKVRTYGSRNSDKENEEGDEGEAAAELGSEAEEEEEAEGDEAEQSLWEDAETSAMMEARMGEELKNAAKKFKEVDKWELSFEEVTESSSPQPEAR